MNPNAIALVAAVTAAAATDVIRRFRKSNPTVTSDQLNLTALEINQILMEEVKRQSEINAALVYQNAYMSHMLDENDVPVTEFDRIIMSNPFTAEQ